MALGLNLLFRLGRRFLAAPAEETGLLPRRYYASQALAALAADDFPACLRYLTLQGPDADPVFVQLLILRCRLLRERHRQQRQAVQELAAQEAVAPLRYQEILTATDQAITLLDRYLLEADQLRAALEPTAAGGR